MQQTMFRGKRQARAVDLSKAKRFLSLAKRPRQEGSAAQQQAPGGAEEAVDAAGDEEQTPAKTQIRRGPKTKTTDGSKAMRLRAKSGPHSSVAIKKELAETVERQVCVQGSLQHYRHQVQCINDLVAPPWELCFGALGSGIIGVRPYTGTPRAPKVKKEKGAEEDAPVSLPADATVILLLNAPTFPSMARNGTTVGGYAEELNVAQSTMRWSSQRRDRHNRMVNAIVAHCQRGGRVVAAARNSMDKLFKLLGEVGHIDDVQKAGFLVRKGDGLLLERGTNLYHKAISISCLNTGLKSGVGLVAVRYPVPAKGELKARWCPNCCFRPPSALLHFKELKPDGVAAYGYVPPAMLKGEVQEGVAEAEAPAAKPEPEEASTTSVKLEPGWKEDPLKTSQVRRLWAKQPASEVSNFYHSISIKQELVW